MHYRPLRTLLLAAASVAVLHFAEPALADPRPSDPWMHDTSDVPVHPQVRFGLLPNGMQYAILRNATPPGQASLRLRIDAGSLMENDDQQGLAHFVEHMVFNGTTNLPETEMLRILERLGLAFGADTNAFTSLDQTVYQLELPRTDDETVDTSLHILREQMSAALMAPDAIDNERNVIAGEERLRNTPAFRSVKAQLGLLAPGQKLGSRMPIGDPVIIQTAPAERFVAFYNAYYRPSRATLVAVGDFDVDVMERKVRQAFETWTPHAEDGPEPDLGTVAPREPETRILLEPGVQSSIQINWTRAPDRTADSVSKRLTLVQRDLGLAVLNRRLLERSNADNPPFVQASGVAYNLYDSLDLTSVYARFNPGAWQEALEAIEQEQRRLVEFGVTGEELAREIASIRTTLENGVAAAATQRTSVLADEISVTVNQRTVFTSAQTNLDLFNAAVANLSAETLNRSLAGFFEGEGPLVLVITPQPIEGGEAAITAALQASRSTAVTPPAQAAELDWPYPAFGEPGVVKERRDVAEIGTTIVTFDNDVVLTVKPTTFRDEQILVEVRTGNGELDLPTDRFSAQSLASSVFTAGGVGALTLDEMKRVLTGRIFSANFSQEGGAYKLSGVTRPQDLNLQMQVLTAYLTEPGLREAPFRRIQSLYPHIMEQAMATPAGAFEIQAYELLSSGDKRQASPSAEEVASWSNEELGAGIRRGLANGPISVVMVGDLTVEDAIAALAPTLGALPRRAPAGPPHPGSAVMKFPEGGHAPVWLPHNGPSDQALGYVAWPTPDTIGDRTEARRVRLLAELLQLRVTDEIREKQALAYSPAVGVNASDIYPDYGFLFIQAETKPETVPAFHAAVEQIVADLKSAPPSADELDRARLPMIEALRRSQASNEYWLANLANLANQPGELEQIQTTISDLEEATPADIQALAKRYLRPETAWHAFSTSTPK